MIYHFRDAIKRAMGVKTVLITAALYVAHSFGSDTLYGGDVGVVHIGFYVSLLLSALLTASLMTIDPGQIPEKWRRVDDTLGDLSYPVFLTHFNVAILLSMFFQFDPVADGPLFFALSIIPVLLVSWGLHISVERLMEPTRDSIRARARLRREQRLALENQ
jgi:peptidoglycan/LPS O-acetylase OafA/YrhL